MLKIKELRTEKGYKQADLANMLSTTIANISGWETEKWQPDIPTLIKLSNIFQCSVDYLIGNENENGMIVMQNELTEDENYLIDVVRQLNQKDKNTLYELADLMLKAKNMKK